MPRVRVRRTQAGAGLLVTLIVGTLYLLQDVNTFLLERKGGDVAVQQAAVQEASVKRAVDGDTVEVYINGRVYKVRMIGIDTPETVDPRKPVQCFGKEASDKTKQLLPSGTKVRLEADPTQDHVDTYGRLLRYVYRLQDNLFVNEYLVRNGYAHEYTYARNPSSMANRFKTDEQAARKEGKGLWAPDTCQD